MTPETTDQEYAAALEACASELLWEAGIVSPPVDAFVLAERLGMLVAQDLNLGARARYARLGSVQPKCGETPGDFVNSEIGERNGVGERGSEGCGGNRGDERLGGEQLGVILLASESRPERRHWAIAHEVGESAAHRVFERLGIAPIDAPATTRESVANRLAGRILAPHRWLAADGRDYDWELPALKQIYATASHELLARRTLEALPTPALVTVLDHGKVSWRRSNVYRQTPPMATAEYDCWRRTHREGLSFDHAEVGTSIARVRCWPVHEPDWRREIMLTELVEGDGGYY